MSSEIFLPGVGAIYPSQWALSVRLYFRTNYILFHTNYRLFCDLTLKFLIKSGDLIFKTEFISYLTILAAGNLSAIRGEINRL